MVDSVLVVGAGPVGLVLGCELLQRGVPVRIVDAERLLTPHSRANVIWSRNLELLRRIEVTDDLLAAGHRIGGVAYYSNRRPLGAVWLRRLRGTPYPFALMIPQSVTEQVLRRRLAALGGTVEQGVRLVGLDAASGPPRVKLEHPDGHVEEAGFGWLVGADGAHSTVRKQLGIGFDGEPVDVSFAIADAPLTTALPDDRSYYCYSPRGGLAMGPLGGGVFRLAVTVPHSDDGVPPPRELFQRVVDERAPGRNVVGELNWSTTFRVRCRIAHTFRAGRCFLVGDAAHIVSPAGGQGMNIGIQDAVNLGWKLAGVLRGELAEAVLDSYDPERRQVADRVARSTALQTRFGVVRGSFRRGVRDALARGAHLTGVAQRYLAPQLSQLDVRYGPAPGRGRGPVPVGGRLPVLLGAPAGTAAAGWPAVARDGFTALVWLGAARSAPPRPWPAPVSRRGTGAAGAPRRAWCAARDRSAAPSSRPAVRRSGPARRAAPARCRPARRCARASRRAARPR
ncbi:hypothetical protein GTS_47850 [Gandjariella thermophila]|uniref:FAD-binding domain-containing protein n=1 Tax=Gandjariella thermophila TaxID=1931992 RepID=A0A4D4JCP7_9PSEU|nr:hypothetical protein GTS_47850 [Gandjariella thermophila]